MLTEDIINLQKELKTKSLELENKNRELEIESSLERVRTVAMGMQKAEDLLNICAILFKELQALGFGELRNTLIHTFNDEQKYFFDYDYSDFTGGYISRIPYSGHPAIDKFIKEIKSADDAFTEIVISGNELEDWKEFRKNNKEADDQRLDNISTLYYYFYSIGPSDIGISTFSSIPDDKRELLKRFRNVFDLAYRRFTDIERAEEHAREAQIEAALEKVRSRSLAMHKSEELQDVVHTVFEKLDELNVELYTAIIFLFTEDSKDILWWLENKANQQYARVLVPYIDNPYLNDIINAREKGKNFFSKTYSFKEKNELFHHLFENTDFKNVTQNQKQFLLESELATMSVALSKNTGINITSYTKKSFTEKENELLIRFGNVFEQAYTRFLDLQKAEVQAREAQIEVAVERVRAKALAMHKSDEIMAVLLTMRNELDSLNIPGVLSTSITLRQADGSIRLWDNTSTKQLEDGLWESTDMVFRLEENHPEFYFNRIWNTNEKYFVIEQDENDLPITVDWVRSFDKGMADTIEHFFKENNIKHCWHPGVQLEHGKLNLDSLIAPEPEMETILLKMGAAFDLAYRRFLDLQKAEFQTRQAKIETALEKVRARALAMHQPEELVEVAEVLRHEMGLLGVEELETCSIYIHDEDIQRIECWYALKDIRSAKKKLVRDQFPLNLQETWVGKEMAKFYQSDSKQVSIVMQGANLREWINYCQEKSIPLRGYYGEVIPDKTYHLYKFSHGAIGAAAAGDISSESWDLLQRASSVFSLAYSRFKDLTHARIDLQRLKEEKQRAESALEELKNTQKQLIQSEKMASLGELTAGIAHEIQNPLNFVNNFSDLSNELIDEMMLELAKGNVDEVKKLVEDVKQNLEKINHHGKRADAIVKGMLLHSRANSGLKEATDINALADEYLRLAYHGLRAKDKSFNATLKTDFDDSIGLINIIPQDIGRVILNLITNAFYACTERSRSAADEKTLRQAQDENFTPTVTVSTKKVDDKIEIKISDNGNGIPQKILNKIFQPFFTTKPTGQGTGLGLSLSYDIVKAHGGEIKIETKEGEGSLFIINIPNDNPAL